LRAGRTPEAPGPNVERGPEPVVPPNNLPAPLTTFVGREREGLEIKRLLSMTRLLTLTGAGGCGKTRLALETGRDLIGAYPEGVWLVELAALPRPELAPRAVATALGLSEQAGRPLEDTLAEHLGRRELLLILDNCEHLVEGAARLAEVLLNKCPNLRILATSREPLGVPGEVVWTVPPLSLPDAGAEPTVESLTRCEAVRLFVDRARSRLPAFRLTPENVASTAAVCLKLDGIPLAIELATARMGALAVEQVAERLEDSLGLLTGGARTVDPRQRTMRATLEWSHELLSEPERELFRRLSVFAGGWTLEAAEEVCPGGTVGRDGVLDLLSRLIDKSLVVAEARPATGALRYRMLEPIRQYGLERLEASGEVHAVGRRHALWYLELAKGAEPWLRGDRQRVWLERLEREHDNLRAALKWSLESGEAELGLWFGGALGEFWYMRGYLSEGRRWLEAALANDAARAPARTKALARAGWIAWEQGDYERSIALSKKGLALSRELGDRAGAAAALSNLSWAALLGDQLDRAAALAEEAATLERSLGETGGVARALIVLGLAAVAGGDHERGLELQEESLALAREAADSLAMALSLVMGAFASLGLGDNRRARALCEKSFALSQRPRVMNVTAFQLHASAALAGSQGLPARSARLWGAAESVRELTGAILSPVELQVYEPYIDAARARLDEAAWEEAWAEGRAMTVEEAVGYALAQEGERRARPLRCSTAEEPPAGGGQRVDGLTRREREVALLVARGLTNRQIADVLTISRNTVANHVAGIIKKLDLPSRSLVAVWVTERRLREPQ
jgi:non-specific serine/threonine protein kinase